MKGEGGGGGGKRHCCRVLFALLKSSVKFLVVASLLCYLASRFLVEFSATQCFTRVVPKVPNHGLTEIPRVKTLSDAELSERMRSGMPVVVTGQMKNWPAMKLWQDINYFSKACPHFEYEGVSLRDFIKELEKIDAYIDAHMTPEEAQNTDFEMYFSHNEELFYECPKLWRDVQNFARVRNHASKPTGGLFPFLSRHLIARLETDFLPAEFVWGDWVQAVTWIGPPGSKTKLHYDDDPLSILYQFKGEKLVRIWSPDQSKFLYPQTSCSDNSEYGTRFSLLENIEDVEYNRHRFPLFQNATGLSTVLKPGEFIYIPSGWWHHVTVLSSSVSVAARSYSTCEGLSYLPNFFVNYLHDRGIIDGEGFCITPSYLL